MFQTSSDVEMSTMCEYPSSKYTLPNRYFCLSCCTKCPQIDPPNPESDQYNSNVSLTISFHFYQHI